MEDANPRRLVVHEASIIGTVRARASRKLPSAVIGILVEGNTAAGIAFDVKGYEVAPGRQQDKVGVSRRSERVRVYVYGSSCVR